MTTATILFLLMAFGLGLIAGICLGVIIAFKRVSWLERLGLIEPVDNNTE
jgi:ABC-type dipeptide/oligopeptide/nickel transport system permease component